MRGSALPNTQPLSASPAQRGTSFSRWFCAREAQQYDPIDCCARSLRRLSWASHHLRNEEATPSPSNIMSGQGLDVSENTRWKLTEQSRDRTSLRHQPGRRYALASSNHNTTIGIIGTTSSIIVYLPLDSIGHVHLFALEETPPGISTTVSTSFDAFNVLHRADQECLKKKKHMLGKPTTRL